MLLHTLLPELLCGTLEVKLNFVSKCLRSMNLLLWAHTNHFLSSNHHFDSIAFQRLFEDLLFSLKL